TASGLFQLVKRGVVHPEGIQYPCSDVIRQTLPSQLAYKNSDPIKTNAITPPLSRLEHQRRVQRRQRSPIEAWQAGSTDIISASLAPGLVSKSSRVRQKMAQSDRPLRLHRAVRVLR